MDTTQKNRPKMTKTCRSWHRFSVFERFTLFACITSKSFYDTCATNLFLFVVRTGALIVTGATTDGTCFDCFFHHIIWAWWTLRRKKMEICIGDKLDLLVFCQLWDDNQTSTQNFCSSCRLFHTSHCLCTPANHSVLSTNFFCSFFFSSDSQQILSTSSSS